VRRWCRCHRGISPPSLFLAPLVFCSDGDGEPVEVGFRLWTPYLEVRVWWFAVVFGWRRHRPFLSRLHSRLWDLRKKGGWVFLELPSATVVIGGE
jgi:hypothetical protein